MPAYQAAARHSNPAPFAPASMKLLSCLSRSGRPPKNWARRSMRDSSKSARDEGVVKAKDKMPRFSFGPATLRDDLDKLAKSIEAGDEIQAEVFSDLLIEDLHRAASVPPPAYKGHRPPTAPQSAGMYCDVAIHIQKCLANINNQRLDLAAKNVRAAHGLFKDSPWYPKDPPPVVE
jgi:hypothetical protein